MKILLLILVCCTALGLLGEGTTRTTWQDKAVKGGIRAVRISARLNSLRLKGISFNLCFGGGAQFSNGEDSLFLMDCIRKGLKIYSYPVVIAKLIARQSTWFRGYNDKYFFDKGVLFSLLYPRLCKVYAIIHCIKQCNQYKKYGLVRAYKQINKGIRYRKKSL